MLRRRCGVLENVVRVGCVCPLREEEGARHPADDDGGRPSDDNFDRQRAVQPAGALVSRKTGRGEISRSVGGGGGGGGNHYNNDNASRCRCIGGLTDALYRRPVTEHSRAFTGAVVDSGGRGRERCGGFGRRTIGGEERMLGRERRRGCQVVCMMRCELSSDTTLLERCGSGLNADGGLLQRSFGQR